MPDESHRNGPAFREAFFATHPIAWDVIRLFEHLPSALFYAKDRFHRYVAMNRTNLREVFGLEDLAEVLGRTDLEFQPPALAEAYHAEDRKVMKNDAMLPNQVWLVPHVAGTPRWYVSTKTPLHGSDGEVVGIAGVMHPIATPEQHASLFREIFPVVQHIDRHYRESISMVRMAQLAGVSSSCLNQRFREILRMTPGDYILSRKIEHARRLLIQTSNSLVDIAIDLGFSDQSHFTKRFRKVTGITPSSYRRRFR